MQSRCQGTHAKLAATQFTLTNSTVLPIVTIMPPNPAPHAAPLREKIAQFESKGGVPVPRAPFGANVPPVQQGGQKRELYGIRMDLKTVWVPSASAGPRGAQKEKKTEPQVHTRGQSGGRSRYEADYTPLPSSPASLPSSGASSPVSTSMHQVSAQPTDPIEEPPSPVSSGHRDALDTEVNNMAWPSSPAPQKHQHRTDAIHEPSSPVSSEHSDATETVNNAGEPSPASSEHKYIEEEQSTPSPEHIPDIPEEQDILEEPDSEEPSIPFVESPESITQLLPSPPPQVEVVQRPSSPPLPSPPVSPAESEFDLIDSTVELKTAYAVKLNKNNIEYGTISIAPPARFQSLPSPIESSSTESKPRLGQTFTSVVHHRVREPTRVPVRGAGKRLPSSPRPQGRIPPSPSSRQSIDPTLTALVANAAALEQRLVAGELPAEVLRRLSARPQPLEKDEVVPEPPTSIEEVYEPVEKAKHSRFHIPLARKRSKHKEDAGDSRWFTDAPPPVPTPFAGWRKFTNTSRLAKHAPPRTLVSS
ncbi:hypothetical protein B0H16DRAFT_369094 [Mycena metata]|uniref:Uncharacterized protein n=1 Tax=Mycena metata TaxID=1033252 RepID=A0AAD7JP99_9AGAR|nr:hypothetical protein B0H16DRAFT_369094 [Mycena metata]